MTRNQWQVQYCNDTGPTDEAFAEWWEVTDGRRAFRCAVAADAEWLCGNLNARPPARSPLALDIPDVLREFLTTGAPELRARAVAASVGLITYVGARAVYQIAFEIDTSGDAADAAGFGPRVAQLHADINACFKTLRQPDE